MPSTSTCRVFFLFVLLLSLCYYNTLSTPWQFDDPPNITNNIPLHINNLMPETLWQTLHAKPFAPGSLYRPIPNFSFALNWYIGQDNPFGYHIVNLIIHILISLLLYQTTLLLFQTPALQQYSQQDAFFIALLSAALWAINPIQTQAVTYIVQRMASLAAMFYICSLFWYLKFRLTAKVSKRRPYLLACILFYFFAIGSKENTALLPLILLLLEFTFFRTNQDPFSKYIRRTLVCFLCLIILFAIYFILHTNYLTNFTTPYGDRPFSIYERLLTEPGIVLFYLSLIFYPLHQRLSIDHDIRIAHSLFGHWATLPAILIISLIIIFGLTQLRKRPIIAFSILFFFINHLIESTIIPLELAHEHRNYLPSMFLFLPVAAGLLYLLKTYSSRNRVIRTTILIFIPLLLISTGWSTYLRNSVWVSKESLWLDALQKAPNNARPLAALGIIAGWEKEKSPQQLALATMYFEKSLTGASPRTSFQDAYLGNIGEVFFMYGLYDQAISYYSKSLAANPHFNNSQYGLAKTLLIKGRLDDAFEEVARAIKTDSFQSRFLNLGGIILLWQNKPHDAMLSISRAMRISRNKQTYSYNLGVAFSKTGYFRQAEWFLKQSSKDMTNIRVLFSLLENSIRSKNKIHTRQFTEKIVNTFSISFIEHRLQYLQHDYQHAPISVNMIKSVIFQFIQEKSKQPIDITTDLTNNK